MAGIPILVFRLEGPIQSWGEHSKWDYRDTSDFPSKSAVIGLIACAMGLERGNKRISELCQRLSLTVRADRRGIYGNDYHTVMGTPLAKADGEKRANGSTVISNRGYLYDASFLVALTGPKQTLLDCKNALDSPVWQIYLGRKSCVPSIPICANIYTEYETIEEAMEKIVLCNRHDESILMQIESDVGEGFYRSDITAEGFQHLFLKRKVKNVLLKVQEDV